MGILSSIGKLAGGFATGGVPGLISAGAGLAGSALSGVGQRQQQKWLEGMWDSIYNQLQQGSAGAMDQSNQNIGMFRDLLMRPTSQFQQFLYGNEGGDDGQIFSFLDRLMGSQAPETSTSPNWMPGFEEQLNNFLSMTGRYQPQLDTIDRIREAGGWTPELQQILGRAMEIGTGQGAPMDYLQAVGTDLLGQRGQTGFTQGLGSLAMNTLAGGGQTAGTNEMQSIMRQILAAGGRTPEGVAGSQGALRLLGGEGQNEATDWLVNRGKELGGQDALIPLDLRASMARDAAGSQAARAAENFKRKAMLRGGGPGVLGAGSQNQALWDFEDQLLQAEADALRGAVTDQQKLQLDQQGQGLATVGQGQGLATQRYGQAADLLAALEAAANQRYGVGLALLPESERIALQRSLGLGELGLGAGQLENTRMNTGGNLLDSFNRTRLGGLNLAQGSQQDATSRLLQSMGMNLSTSGQYANMFPQAIQMMLGAQGQGFDQAMRRGAFDQGILSQQGNTLAGLMDFQNRNTGAFGDLAQWFGDQSHQILMGLPNLMNPAQTTRGSGNALYNALGPMISSGAQSLSGALSGGGGGQRINFGTPPWVPSPSASQFPIPPGMLQYPRLPGYGG